jgi:integrase
LGLCGKAIEIAEKAITALYPHLAKEETVVDMNFISLSRQKSSGSLRDIDILPEVHQALLAQKPISWLMGEHVFLDPKQKPINQEIFRQKAWAPVLKRLGIRYRPPYQMRHSFATLALSLGENPNWVSRMLGHKSLVMTLERYNRYVPNLTREDGKLLAGTSKMGKRFPTSEII